MNDASTRRTFLLAGIITPLGAAQQPPAKSPAFTLEIANLPLKRNQPLAVAANTSGFTSCQVQVMAGQKIAWQSRNWGTEPNRSISATVASLPGGSGGSQQKFAVRAVLNPTSPAKPSMALAIEQGPGLNVTLLEQLAERARFVADPARFSAGGGRFEVRLQHESAVLLQIWQGEIAKGVPLFRTNSLNIPPGRPIPIPWNLRTNSGALVQPGRYLALLTCTPNDPRRNPTNVFSSFGVVA